MSLKTELSHHEGEITPLESPDRFLTAEEKFPHINRSKLLRKCDLHIIPMLAVLYLMSFLDRGNIGNARIEGIIEDLNLTGTQFNWSITVFFFTYCVFEVPSNMLLKHIRPSIYLPSIMVLWGIVMTLMGIVNNYAGLIACRVLLGVFEAGLFPGVTYYLTMWYCRSDMQYRQAMFFTAAGLAGAFSGLLAFGIGKMRGTAGLNGWQWIFILEGIATVVVAVFAYWALYDFPENAKFLTQDEREFLQYSLEYDGYDRDLAAKGASSNQPVGRDNSNDKEFVWQAFKDVQSWLGALAMILIVVPLYSLYFFTPIIVNSMGHSVAKSQLLSAPPALVGAIANVFQAYFSDKTGKRFPFLMANFSLGLVGYSLCIAYGVKRIWITYAGCCIVNLGMQPCFICFISWISVNVSGPYKRAIAMAIVIGLGNMGGAIASNVYRAPDAPAFKQGHTIAMSMVAAGMAIVIGMYLGYGFVNRRKTKNMLSGKYDHLTGAELARMGDRSPFFIYRT
ncbi:major facilitator superfamily domain-containing protein [Yarrowia lipolytica]|jgi:MFS family permease|uniref:YALI0C08569p n=2 Tax=Yarrowia lipolytica TaxID=4952 RepID=Q6CCK8_YARLI|nr:YALI0C08569p [Yarrowia lipolytica CLIB122]AOW02532.1 hypothetical protein YALI1_C11773g [Yarrowia lipolytica]KAB8280877.1 major facilitator superfamily domain-containing protein [Yarrowia lipolytica]KAE8169682.1 major facilitator superfamily domain-containing protein [Yarrowia lipolytica]KAJ8053220.1 major facilitator superfamily domain-containing protein [Yarrowia lipolytica]QNP97372.1 MFS transporter prlL [Yarrowia lipolytica]|eukprot:XP_501604.1 YALI0C08569p [Yarrowia lipolytica CLIB122]